VKFLLVLAAILLIASPAGADTPPSVWDKARDPDLSEHWALHVKIQRLLSTPRDEDTTTRLQWERDAELRCEAALAMLDDAGAATSPDVRLRFDLGTVQFELARRSGRMDLYEKAGRTLSAALAMAPDAEGSTEALGALADIYAHLDRPRDELDAWHRYIPRILSARERAVEQMNMAEAEMRLGHVDDALTTLHEVLRECAEVTSSPSTYVLTLWDVAVALDRTGDARGALETATKAAGQRLFDSQGYPSTGLGLLSHDENVFFVPAWEKHWYLALGTEALGRQDTDLREAVAYLTSAEQHWDEYILEATAAGVSASASEGPRTTDDVSQTAAIAWLRIAHLRRERVHRELVAASKRVPPGRRLPSTVTE
jgi:tetratricopeptide (TPR) repeat protein